MLTSMVRPTTANRLRKKRFATSAPGESTFTRRSSFREYCSSCRSFCFSISLLIFRSPPYEMRTRGSTTAYRMSAIRLPASVSTAIKVR